MNTARKRAVFNLHWECIALPFANWTVISSNMQDAGGDFIFTNPLIPGAPETFYPLQLQ